MYLMAVTGWTWPRRCDRANACRVPPVRSSLVIAGQILGRSIRTTVGRTRATTRPRRMASAATPSARLLPN